MHVVCVWYACNTHVVCTWCGRGLNAVRAWFARGIHVLSTWYACGMHVVCMLYVCGMHGICTWYARGMRAVYTWSARGTHVVCTRCAHTLNIPRRTFAKRARASVKLPFWCSNPSTNTTCPDPQTNATTSWQRWRLGMLSRPTSKSGHLVEGPRRCLKIEIFVWAVPFLKGRSLKSTNIRIFVDFKVSTGP